MQIPRKIESIHHRGVDCPISYILSSLASQENCDYFECDVMMAAAEYIEELERFIIDSGLADGIHVGDGLIV